MKRVKNGSLNFKQMSVAQMSKTKGGYWVNVIKPDGTVEPIWVE